VEKGIDDKNRGSNVGHDLKIVMMKA